MIKTSCLASEDDAPGKNDRQCGYGTVDPGKARDCDGEERSIQGCNASQLRKRCGNEWSETGISQCAKLKEQVADSCINSMRGLGLSRIAAFCASERESRLPSPAIPFVSRQVKVMIVRHQPSHLRKK